MNSSVSIFITLCILTSCSVGKSTFDQNGEMQQTGTPIKLGYFKHKGDYAFQHADTATFIITDPQELQAVMEEIKHADNPEPWKGAGWDRIKLYFTDTILMINTNGRKIGTSASGTFYDLKKDNFITKRIN